MNTTQDLSNPQNVIEVHKCDNAIDQVLAGLKGKKEEAISIAADAVQFLSCSYSNIKTIQNQGFFTRIWGALTGRNANLRDISQQNLISAQKSALKLIQRLAEQDTLQMDAILVLANMVNYMQFKNIETKRRLVEILRIHEDRIQKVEKQLDIVDKVHTWAFVVRNRSYTDIPNRAIRLLAFVEDALEQNVSEWRTADIEVFSAAVLDVGFQKYETITIRKFVEEYVAASGNNKWKGFLLPASTRFEDNNTVVSLPCFSALLESTSLLNSAQKFRIIQAAIDLAKESGVILDPKKLMVYILTCYLTDLGVDLDIEIPVQSLAVELFVGKKNLARLANITKYPSPSTNKKIHEGSVNPPKAKTAVKVRLVSTTKPRNEESELHHYNQAAYYKWKELTRKTHCRFAAVILSNGKLLFVQMDATYTKYHIAESRVSEKGIRLPSVNEAKAYMKCDIGPFSEEWTSNKDQTNDTAKVVWIQNEVPVSEDKPVSGFAHARGVIGEWELP